MAGVTHHLRPEPGVTEIRIHGVGGTTPEALLEQTGVRQVTGDDTAGMYRGAIVDPGRAVEAYSWGGLTARSRSRAFWVVLLPFSLINLSGWMVEPRHSADPAGGDVVRRSAGTKWHEVLVQFIAISTTAMYVMWAALLSMNTVAFQCGAIPECRQDRWYLDPFEAGYFSDHPGRRVLAALLVPLGLLALFVILGRLTMSRYDDYGSARRSVISEDDPAAGSVLGLSAFWYPSRWQWRLVGVHVGAVLLLLGGLLGRASAEFETHFGVDVVPDVGYALFWVCVTTAVVLLTSLGLATWRAGPVLEAGRIFPAVTWAAVAVAAAALAVAAGLTWRLDVPDRRLAEPTAGVTSASTDLWGFGWAPILLLAMAATFVALFSVVQLWRWFVARLFFFDQFVVVVMLAFLVLWPWAPWVGLVAAVAATGTQWAPDLVARVFRSRPAPGPGPALWRLAVLLAVCGSGVVAWQLTGDAATPFGAGWPRLTPVLLFTATLVGLSLVQTRGATMNDPSAGKHPAARVGLLGFPAALIGFGLLLTEWLGRTEWVHSAVWLAWVVAGIVWLAQFQFEGYDRWRWNGPASVAVLALAVLMGTFSGLAIWLVDLLDRDGTRYVLRATAIYQWLAVVFAAMLVTIGIGMAVWYVLIRLGIGPRGAGSRAGETLAEAVRAADVVVTMGSLLLVWAAVALVVYLDDRYEGTFQRWIDDGPPASWNGIVQAASWVALGAAAGVFFVIRRGMRDHAFRTRFGILWDVAGFWPRWFHPFAPPAYAMRAVPELQARLTEVATGGAGGAAIVSAHSQGSVVGVAAVASLRPDVRRRVRLVTHGSPLARFYQRFFPAYFSAELFEHCARQLGNSEMISGGGWLNYWRRTDPIGDPVFGAQERQTPPDRPSAAVRAALELSESSARTLPDIQLADPVTTQPNEFARRPARRGHSGYMADPAMWRAIDALSSELAALPVGVDPADHADGTRRD